MYLHIMSALTT